MDSTIYLIGDVAPEWRSIPYGAPMANQTAYVVDSTLSPLPVGIALISSVGLLASALTPSIIGVLKDLTGTFTIGIVYAAAALLAASVLLFWIDARRRKA